MIGALGAIGVVMGALGAHALKPRLEAAGLSGGRSTAVSYHMIHVIASLAVWVLLAGEGRCGLRRGPLRAATLCWLAGAVFFSGSIYLLSLGGPRWLGPVTPLGGLIMITGWVCLGMGCSGRGRG